MTFDGTGPLHLEFLGTFPKSEDDARENLQERFNVKKDDSKELVNERETRC